MTLNTQPKPVKTTLTVHLSDGSSTTLEVDTSHIAQVEVKERSEEEPISPFDPYLRSFNRSYDINIELNNLHHYTVKHTKPETEEPSN